MRSERYTNTALSVIALFLGLLVVGQFAGAGPGPAQANAQSARVRTNNSADEPRSGGMVSAADQRKVMISELRDLASRMERIEGMLSRGLDVKVKEMPPLQLPKQPAEKPEGP